MKKKIGYALVILILIGCIINNIVEYGFLISLVSLLVSIGLYILIGWLLTDDEKESKTNY